MQISTDALFNQSQRDSNHSPPPWLASLPSSLRRTPCSLPVKRRRKRRGKRGGVAVKIKLLLAAKREFRPCLVIPNHDVDYRRFVVWRPSDPVCSWIIPALPAAFAQLPRPRPRSPRLRRGGVRVQNLRSLCRTTQAAGDGPVRVRMALVNARSAVNKTFILNDFFTSRSLDFQNKSSGC